MKRNVIEIWHIPNGLYKIKFTDRNGKKVFCHHEDPQILLNMRQKESFFMGHFIFSVNDSDIKDLEKLINWPQ
jgi:hypothetical protein